MKVINLLARAVFGAVFIFSGFVKAVDPWGTAYKIEEYLSYGSGRSLLLGIYDGSADVFRLLQKNGKTCLCGVYGVFYHIDLC